MKGKLLIVLVSVVMLAGVFGYSVSPTQAKESFSTKWQSNPDGDKIDEGESKTYDLSIENKLDEKITITISSSSSGLEIYPKTQDVKISGGFVALS